MVGIADVNTGGGQPASRRAPETGPFSPLSTTPHTSHGRDFRNLRNSPTTTNRPERPPDSTHPDVGDDGQNDAMDPDQHNAVDLGRIAWLGTVTVCLVVVLILTVQGY